jgi:putative aminopeptidase FrvX
MNFDINYFKEVAHKIFNIDSPSGYSENINKVLIELLNELGYTPTLTNKGNVALKVAGESNEKTVATSAHVDTLGLMVRSINGDGTLNVTRIGGPQIATLDGEYCKIQTRFNQTYTGTILSNSASSHVYEDSDKQRKENNVVVRIDEKVNSKKDVLDLGIQNGDYIFIEPKFTITESGFIKSRFIDDKASVCVILSVLKYLKENNLKPAYDTFIYFVNHEEVGHGAATVDENITEFVTVDMGCIGKDLAGNEYAVSIAAKDSGGPYDYELTTRLIKLAKENNVNYVVDIFPYYGSDVGASYRSGRDLKGALIGQGVHASHGMERTHLDGIVNTMNLLTLYLLNK